MPTDHPEFVHPSNPDAAERLLEEAAAAVAAADGEVIIGPWLGEVGFEVLYWIPFLRWFAEKYGLDSARTTVVSRGGVGAWYTRLHECYVDIFDVFTPDEFRTTTLALWESTGGLQKQVAMREWDEAVLDRTIGVDWRERAVLHPSLMYRLFRNVWQGALPLRDFLDRARQEPWPRPEGFETYLRGLPERYTAVRFYFRESFPATAENRAVVDSVVRRLAATRPVVLLNTDVVVDDHVDAEPTDVQVHRPLAGVSPARNLGAQTAVIAGASLFVGTYGGLAHLAPFYRVPTIGFASDSREINPVHLALARRTADDYRTALAVTDGRGFDALAALGAAA